MNRQNFVALTIISIVLSEAAQSCLGILGLHINNFAMANPKTLNSKVQTSTTWSSPVVITKGGTYSGNWSSSNPDTPAVKVLTSEPVLIQNCKIQSKGDGIWSLGVDSNLTIRNCLGQGLNPNISGRKKGNFINVGNFSQVTMEKNTINSFGTGVRALNYGSSATEFRYQTVIIRYNVFNNTDGRISNGQGGYLTDLEGAGGNAVGLNTLLSANVEIAWNAVVNQPYKSNVEDLISTYHSSGTQTNPIIIHDNYLQGGYAPDPKANVAYSGAMINISDCPEDIGYISVYNNQIVSFENSGILISGGHDIRVHDNRIISAQKAPDGTILGGIWRTGLVLWDYYNSGSSKFYNNQMFNNSVNVVNKDGYLNQAYLPSLGGSNQVTGTTDPLGHLATQADLTDEYNYWTQKISALGLKLGYSSNY